MSDRRAEIRNAYRQTGGHVSFYDGMMTYSTFLGKAICRVVWNMDGEERCAEEVRRKDRPRESRP